MRKTWSIATIAVLALSTGVSSAAIAAPAPSASTSAAAAASALREYEGRVLSVNRDARTFRLRDSERGVIRVHVTRSTRYERIAGFAGVRAGQTGIEVTVRRVNGTWRAVEVERSGGGGRHGGDDD